MVLTPRFTDWADVEKHVVAQALASLRRSERTVMIDPDEFTTVGNPDDPADFYFKGKPYRIKDIEIMIQEIVKAADNDR